MWSTADKLRPRQRTAVLTHVACPLRSTRTEAIAKGPVVADAVTAAWCADTADAGLVTALSEPPEFAVGAQASCVIVVPVTIWVVLAETFSSTESSTMAHAVAGTDAI